MTEATDPLDAALEKIDLILRDISGTSITSTSVICDHVLDLRNHIVAAQAIQDQFFSDLLISNADTPATV